MANAIKNTGTMDVSEVEPVPGVMSLAVVSLSGVK